MKYKPLLVLFCLLASCAPSRFVKPLAAKEKAVNLSLGGPLIVYSGLTIPVPFVTATYGYGVDSSLTGFGSINLTSALYGNVQFELGVTKNIIRQHGNAPGISVSPVANVILRPKERGKLYPQLDLNAYWNFNHDRNLIYAGLSNWFELSGKKASGLKQTNHWLLSPMIGHSFIRKMHELILEAKVLAPGLQNDRQTVDYQTPFGTHGALGIYFAYTRKF
jgi:hypothetical protein